MQELQIKQAEVQRKIAKDQADAAARDKQLQIELARIDAQKEIAGANIAVKVETDRMRMDRQQESEGFRATVDLSKQRQQQQNRPPPPQKGKSK
jgi:hypothetical protein